MPRLRLAQPLRLDQAPRAPSLPTLDRTITADADRYGTRRARLIWQISRAATRRIIRTLRELDIRCGLAECDSIYYATRIDSGRRLSAEYLRRAAAGLPATWLDETALRRAIGIKGPGGICV